MFTTKCAMCKEVVGHGPECSACKLKYHFRCGGISERGFDRLGLARDTWKCNPCREEDVKSHTVNDETLLTSDGTPGHSRFFSGFNLDHSSTPKQSGMNNEAQSDWSPREVLNDILSKMAVLQSQFSAIHLIQSDLKQVTKDIADLKLTVNSRLDDFSERVTAIENRVSVLETSKTDLDEIKNITNRIIEDSYKNEQWVRRSNIQINGIPHKVGENLLQIIKTLSDRCNFPINLNTDIDFVTRIAVKNNTEEKKPKPIIVKLQSRYKKDDFLSALRRLKDLKAHDLGFVGASNRIYINDHLSTRNKFLLQQARIMSKKKNYAYCWVRNCTVMVRRSDNSPVLHITSEDDLKKIV
ncbi:unnamed protein product [Euphydryas editha]|uniref:FP protein C-terminal domain-containing protein n=1 Tax=Euphydryas editha TaxID=104508 RepID=A0AAU9V3V8_EUPED|nr:unnamed protein product [Euphydryas editha]